MKKLDFAETLKDAFAIGIKNFFSLLGCVVLWLLTIWIPYVNVGTTIAISTLPAALSKGTILSPLEIFNKKYFKFMGEYFLVTGLRFLIILPASIFLFIPAIVLSLSYILSTLGTPKNYFFQEQKFFSRFSYVLAPLGNDFT